MGTWNNPEIEALKDLYVETDMPSDNLIKDKTAMADFTSQLNAKLSLPEAFIQKEVADQLLRLRKSGKLPRIRR